MWMPPGRLTTHKSCSWPGPPPSALCALPPDSPPSALCALPPDLPPSLCACPGLWLYRWLQQHHGRVHGVRHVWPAHPRIDVHTQQGRQSRSGGARGPAIRVDVQVCVYGRLGRPSDSFSRFVLCWTICSGCSITQVCTMAVASHLCVPWL